MRTNEGNWSRAGEQHSASMRSNQLITTDYQADPTVPLRFDRSEAPSRLATLLGSRSTGIAFSRLASRNSSCQPRPRDGWPETLQPFILGGLSEPTRPAWNV